MDEKLQRKIMEEQVIELPGLAAQEYLVNLLRNGPIPSYEDAANSSQFLKGLAQEAAYAKLEKENPPMRDATEHLLIAAQGPKAFTYLSPELTSALRVNNAVRTKDAMRLTGVPTKKEVQEALADKDALDRLKWKVTGQGLKANAWYNSYGGQQ